MKNLVLCYLCCRWITCNTYVVIHTYTQNITLSWRSGLCFKKQKERWYNKPLFTFWCLFGDWGFQRNLYSVKKNPAVFLLSGIREGNIHYRKLHGECPLALKCPMVRKYLGKYITKHTICRDGENRSLRFRNQLKGLLFSFLKGLKTVCSHMVWLRGKERSWKRV